MKSYFQTFVSENIYFYNKAFIFLKKYKIKVLRVKLNVKVLVLLLIAPCKHVECAVENEACDGFDGMCKCGKTGESCENKPWSPTCNASSKLCPLYSLTSSTPQPLIAETENTSLNKGQPTNPFVS